MRNKFVLFAGLMIGLMGFIPAARIEVAASGGILKSHALVGVAPSLELFRNLYLEGEFTYMPRFEDETTYTQEIYFNNGPAIQTSTFKSSLSNLNLSLRYDLKFGGRSRFIPFITAGAGAINEIAKSDMHIFQNDQDVYSFSYSPTYSHLSIVFGGGIKYAMSGTLGIRLDVRFIHYLENSDGPTEFDSLGTRINGGFYIAL